MDMKIEVIDGSLHLDTPHSPIYALNQFYRAFNTSDLQLMKNNWVNGDEASLANPLGGLRRGWQDIEPLYVSLFAGKAEVYVEYFDFIVHERGEIFQAVGRERGYFRRDCDEIELAIRTSRTYQKVKEGWRQLHHHGSIEDPDLLQRYQQAVFGLNQLERN